MYKNFLKINRTLPGAEIKGGVCTGGSVGKVTATTFGGLVETGGGGGQGGTNLGVEGFPGDEHDGGESGGGVGVGTGEGELREGLQGGGPGGKLLGLGGQGGSVVY